MLIGDQAYSRPAWMRKVLATALGVMWLGACGCGPNGPKQAAQPKGPSPPISPPGPAATQPTEVVQPAPTVPSTTITTPAPPSPPPKPTVPPVMLSQSLRASCVLWVGDTLPGGRLTDLSGQPVGIREQLGERLTVVAFWSAEGTRLARLAAQKLLVDLQEEVARPFASDGVRVLAIHVGELDQEGRELVEKSGISYPVLVDAKRAYFALVARGYLPRIYLLDQRGRVLWLDLNFTELSGKTRDDLILAIQAALSLAGS